MRAWMCVVIAACASGKAEQPAPPSEPATPPPAAAAPAPKAETQVAMNAPAPGEPKAAGDPDEGGQAAPTTIAMADSAGQPGLGVRGSGPGGGGTGEGTTGIGTIGTIGKGAGGGTGEGFPGIRARPGNQPRVAPGNPTTQGNGLAKEIVVRVVRRNLNRVRYCYEKSLTKNPSLAGLLTVKFVIRADGNVDRLEAHFSPDPEVAACMDSAFRGVEFPKPSTGIVVVNYPFNLSPE